MSKPTADAALNWTTRITEKTRFQFRAEIFNVANTFLYTQQQFSSSLTSSAFGSINKGSIAFTNTNQPRYLQLGFKYIW